MSALESAYWTDGFQERTCFTVRRCSHPDFRHACLLREDLAACTTLPGPLPPQPGMTYVVSLDVGVVNDRTVLTVMHAEETPSGRKVMLDRIDRWQGTRSAPVHLGDVRDTLIARAAEYRPSAVVDPHQAVLIAQEARAAGVAVHEFPFTAASVGRITLSLHQAIRNHRVALPDDELLLDELVAVRLRKNSLGIYRLDHDAGQHDDQAIALALGAHYLLDTEPEPVFVVFADEPAAAAGTENVFDALVLEDRGGFAVRPDRSDPWAQVQRQSEDAFGDVAEDEDGPPPWIVRTVPG